MPNKKVNLESLIVGIAFIVIMSLLVLWMFIQYDNEFFDATMIDLVSLLMDIFVGFVLVYYIFLKSTTKENNKQLLIIVDEVLKSVINRIEMTPTRIDTHTAEQEKYSKIAIEKTKVNNDILLIEQNIPDDCIKKEISKIKDLFLLFWENISDNYFITEKFDEFANLSNKRIDQIVCEIQKLRFSLYTFY